MAQSRYYRAAESFTRASVYRPGDALPHLGKSLALFAAGDYVSSSLLLARAIELNPPCAVAQVNLVDVVGGPGRFEQRLADLERCLKSNDAQQLQFLLAYVYHQIGRSHDAARAAAAAQKAMPSSLVVDILKAAVAP
jgi:tetratricopeptide (TPR) repeat protein